MGYKGFLKDRKMFQYLAVTSAICCRSVGVQVDPAYAGENLSSLAEDEGVCSLDELTDSEQMVQYSQR